LQDGRTLDGHNYFQENFIPSKSEYAAEGGKEMLEVLQTAAKFVPIPFIQEAIAVALKVLQACEVRLSPQFVFPSMLDYPFRTPQLLEKKSRNSRTELANL
jgi:hypothetical protein